VGLKKWQSKNSKCKLPVSNLEIKDNAQINGNRNTFCFTLLHCQSTGIAKRFALLVFVCFVVGFSVAGCGMVSCILMLLVYWPPAERKIINPPPLTSRPT
jgi:hypothetical protein